MRQIDSCWIFSDKLTELCTVLECVVTMYTRAAASDYDDWATVYGNRGWSSADLLPLLGKVRKDTAVIRR